MRKLLILAFLCTVFAGLASAQIPTSGNVFFGYSYLNTNYSSGLPISGSGMNGWNGSVEAKIIPFLGFVGDVSSYYGSQSYAILCPSGQTCPTVTQNISEQNYLFGPRVSVSVGKFRPFAEALFGAGHLNANSLGSDTSFATAIGGGLDYRLIRLVAWRFQGDYVQTRFFDTHQNNFRLSTGIVLHF